MEDKSNLLPERAGQADVMTVAGGSSLMEADPDAGHWYSPAAVRVILQAAIAVEREACIGVIEECIRTQSHLASNAREALSEAASRIYKRGAP